MQIHSVRGRATGVSVAGFVGDYNTKLFVVLDDLV